MALRAVRGATRVGSDDRDEILEATRELVQRVMDVNGVAVDDVVDMFFTATGDLSSVAPAVAARQLGYLDTALICLQEMHVDGALTHVVRLLAHVETDRPQRELEMVYLRGTDVLRGALPPVPGA